MVRKARSETGDFRDRKFREVFHPSEPSWFSYELAVNETEGLELVATYGGDDGGEREFDILVNGRRIATQILHGNRPGEFFEARYPLPAELTRAHKSVTVRVQARPNRRAGGVFGLFVMRAR